MKYLVSIAWRIFDVIEETEVFRALDESELEDVGGFELATKDLDIMMKMVEFCKVKGMVFQCHTPNFKDLELVFPYLEDVDKVAKVYGKKVNVVLHSKEDDDLKKSIEDTKIYVKRILDFIDDKKLDVVISLENLNHHHGHQRVNMSLIDNILVDFDTLKFTYDIGHDIFDNVKNSELTNLQKEKINNVHLHNVHEGKDHVTMFKTPENVEYLKSAINNLKKMNYSGNVVIEVGFDFYEGETNLEKLKNYINSVREIKKEFE